MSRCLCVKTEEGWVVCDEHAPALGNTAKHWPHQPTSEQLTLELLDEKKTVYHCEQCHQTLPESEANGHSCGGVKYDASKPDLSLLPREFLEEVARAFMYGEKKYGRYNYLNGLDWHRVLGAAFRHLSAFNDGEDKDPESGLSHLSHLGACCAMALVYYKRGLGRDTRYKATSEQPISTKKE